ncbi:hypothetical protein BJY00DRAFT_227274 [Aspergillus carlsbadensis]|nr:hypothetical protein BJY00DRAFT_227274 [Aspergillus carlsbadensis]
MAKALLLQVGAEPPRNELSGAAVHYRCWELLCIHPIWTTSGKDIKALFLALQRKSEEDWGFLYGWDDSDSEHILGDDGSSNDSELFMEDPPMEWEHSDPFFNKHVQGLIHKAKRVRTEQLPQKIKTKLDGLPLEVLWMSLDLLPTEDVTSLENGICCYMSDAYWRSRTDAKLFHELRGLPDEELNWRFLCLELETLTIERKPDFYGRRWVLKRLDDLEELLPSPRVSSVS